MIGAWPTILLAVFSLFPPRVLPEPLLLRDHSGSLTREEAEDVLEALEDLFARQQVYLVVEVVPSTDKYVGYSAMDGLAELERAPGTVLENARPAFLAVCTLERTAALEFSDKFDADRDRRAVELVTKKLLPAWKAGSLSKGLLAVIAELGGFPGRPRGGAGTRLPVKWIVCGLLAAAAALWFTFGLRRWKPVPRRFHRMPARIAPPEKDPPAGTVGRRDRRFGDAVDRFNRSNRPPAGWPRFWGRL